MGQEKTNLDVLSKTSRAWAEVDLSALEHNVSEVRRVLPPGVGLISVVKADAYGHGVRQVVERLNVLNLQGYGVASPREGAEVRATGVKEPIIVFGPVFPCDLELVLSHDLSVTVSSMEELCWLSSALSGTRKNVCVHIKVDTGMGRMGVPLSGASSLVKYIEGVKNLKLTGVYTHLASAGEQDDFTALQRTHFAEFIGTLPSTLNLSIHVDNSAGATVFDASGPWSAVRLGLMQYGCEPCPLGHHSSLVLKPVLSAHARVGLIKSLPIGSTISYAGTHQLARNSTVAVVTVGYADGLSIHLSNRGSMLVGGKRCPVLGRVCMDLTVLDVTDCLEPPKVGDLVTWIGSQGEDSIRAEELSSWADSIPWECLCSLSRRVPRIYLS